MDDQPVRVLLIEDNPGDARLIRELLADTNNVPFDLRCANRLLTGVEVLGEGGIDVVLLDLSLPDSSGLETLRRVHAYASRIPIVILTGLDDELLAMKAVREGAQDYLVKAQLNVALLVRSLRYAIERKRIIEDLKAAQDQLVQTKTLRAVGELAAGMAHHLNNLLAVMLLQIDLLLAKTQPSEDRHALEMDRQALERVAKTILSAADVVRRVLEFGRMQPGSEAAPVEVVDLTELAQDTLELTRPLWEGQARSRGIQIQVALKPEPAAPVSGDESALREVLLNVLLNAIDALPEGGKITIETWVSGQWVYCAVTDTGAGMSKEVRERALEPFFTTKGTESTGLGLSLAYGIIQRHGGHLAIESAEGKGTIVTISLPLGASS